MRIPLNCALQNGRQLMVVTAATTGWSFVKVIFMLCVWQSNGQNLHSYNQMGTGTLGMTKDRMQTQLT